MNLKDYARLHGTNIKKLAEASGVPASTLYAISSGDTDFDHTGISVFISISSALGVSTDDLYCALRFDGEPDGEAWIEPLNSDEMELVELYRSLPEKGQHAVLTGLRDFADQQ